MGAKLGVVTIKRFVSVRGSRIYDTKIRHGYGPT